MTKKRKPTLKQSKFVDEYVANGGNATKAAMVSYDAKNKIDAGNIGTQNMAKPLIQDLVDSKIKELKDGMLDTMKDTGLMKLAMQTAELDLMDEDPRVRAEARKYILKLAEFLTESERKRNGTTNNYLSVPKWKG